MYLQIKGSSWYVRELQLRFGDTICVTHDLTASNVQPSVGWLAIGCNGKH